MKKLLPLLLSLIFMCAGLRAGDTRATVINQQTNFKTGPQTEITLVASSTQTLEIERIEVFGVVSGEERKLEDARRRLEQAVDALGRVLRAYQIEYAALPAEPVLLMFPGETKRYELSRSFRVSVPSLEKYDELLLALTGADCRVTGLRFHFTDLEAVANRALVAAAEDLKRQELFMEETLGIELTVTDISIRRDIPLAPTGQGNNDDVYMLSPFRTSILSSFAKVFGDSVEFNQVLFRPELTMTVAKGFSVDEREASTAAVDE